MNETQAEVLTMIETVAKKRGEDMATFMDSNYGIYWTDRYYQAEPDVEQEIEASTNQKAAPTTTGFQRLQACARELIAKDSDLTEPMAIAKACSLYPELVASHESEMRKAVG